MLEKVPASINTNPPCSRIHWFEFGDLASVPQLFHNLMTDILGYMATTGLYDGVIPIISEVLKEQECHTIVDLCTGSGGPAVLLKEKLKECGVNINLVLTDKFPNMAKAKNMSKQEGVTYLEKSIDATQLPDDLKGFRTLFASLHHFRPEQVKAILQDAVNSNQPIAALEFTERTWTRIFYMIPGTLRILRMTPHIKPFSFVRLFWTYIIPVMPMIYFWDGLISNLRTYTPDELKAIVSKLDNNHFTWQINTIPTAIWPFNVTYIIGRPDL